MYSKEQREKALALYDKCHSVTKVIQVLGYPESRQGLYLWLRQRNNPPKKRKPNEKESTTHRIIPSIHHLKQSLIFFVVVLSKGKTYN